MDESKYRVLLIASHPVQYAAPLFRLMAQHPKLDILVAYCSLQGAQPGIDPEFGVEVTWDIPLLDDYPWIGLSNQSPKPVLGKFWGLVNLELWELIRRENFDAVVVYTGYAYASFWIAAAAAKLKRTSFLFGTDAHTLSPRDRQFWKTPLKKWLLPNIFNLADIVIVPSSGGVRLMHSLGIPEHRVQLTPYVVNNNWWSDRAEQVDRKLVRNSWEIPEDAPVILFCAKLQPWKRPQDVLQAFAQANISGSYLVLAGEGPLRGDLEREAQNLKVVEQVKFLGFVNQSQLPSVYSSADLFVLPSEHEPFGVVVNEAMLCGCTAVVSDRVGARYDLVRHGETGFVFPCGDIEALASIFQEVLPDYKRLKQMGKSALERITLWSPQENVETLVQAIERSLKKKTQEPVAC
jgi:glycosyltransferase involved in cell wall biosynthesis